MDRSIEEKDVVVGKTYHNGGTRRRTVVGFHGSFVLYRTPSHKKQVLGVSLWNFVSWAKGIVGEGKKR
ncbi:hypothetical protein ACFYKX_10965 [Cytobacillus sp. FJAT-54145]|uniref:Uncharacterized protein n=1 Tax=Cytobacillus spartinae TaxID=3299023 RepID=A0ABW6KA77_9BACI